MVKRFSNYDNNSLKMTNHSSTWGYLHKLEVVCTLTLAKKCWENLQLSPEPSRDHFKPEFRSLGLLVGILQDFESIYTMI